MKTEIGKVVHYFTKLGVAVIKLVGDFKVGDTIHVKGATTDFEQVVESMQLDKVAVNEAKVGDEIAIKVSDRVRQDDIVYKK